MTIQEQFSCMVGAYYGVAEMDEYPLKEYVLYDLEVFIKRFVSEHPNVNFSYLQQSEFVFQHTLFKTKLQDALLILPKLNVSMEFLFLIKKRIREIQENESF